MAVMGGGLRRLEGEAKVTGATRYTADMRIADMAHVKLVLSIEPHARITGIDTEQAKAVPGVLAVVTGRDIEVGASGTDRPLALDRVFYVGQPIAAVIAIDEAIAADAAALVEVEYEPLPAVLDPFEAMSAGAPTVLEEQEAGQRADSGEHGAVVQEDASAERPPNTTSVIRFHEGDVAAALAQCDSVVKRTYRIPAVHQGFLEPHIAAARAEPDAGFTIWTSTQGAFLVRGSVSSDIGVSQNRVRVVPMAVGGGFGGKFGLLETLVALLAKQVNRPVQLALTRTEEFLMGRGSPGCVIELELGGTRDGRLGGLRARVIFDNGAGPGDYAGICALLLAGTYRLEAFDITGLEVATHKTPVGAYRAPGGPQAYFALECALDELASELGVGAMEMRLRHAMREGDRLPDGDAMPRVGLVEVLEKARQHPLLREPVSEGEGVGVAVGGWPGGYEPAAALCRVESDGSVTLRLGSTDLSGTNTGFALIAARELGVPVESIRVETGDTSSAPYAGGAGGSKITYSVGPAVAEAAAEARRQIFAIASEELNVVPSDLEIAGGMVRVRGWHDRALRLGEVAAMSMRFGGQYAPIDGQGRAAVDSSSPMFTVHIARVRVDEQTGNFAVTGYAAVQDVGHAINPPEIEGQIHGGVAQGLGRALGEEMVWDETGQLKTATFVDYHLPSADQVPKIDVDLVEIPSDLGPFGARGVGEPPAVPGAAAVANAIAAATGRRITSLPLRGEDLVVAPVSEAVPA